MTFKERMKRAKHLFLRFWHSENSKISLLRDVFIAFIIVLIILTVLWAYTGQWFGAPMVAIESGSMMHDNEPFGRLGTIDAGDMVLLVKVNSRSDVVTRGSNLYGAFATKNPDYFHYGEYGDVIIYRPDGNPVEDQIIHRAMCWIEYHEEYDTYSVQEYGINNETSIGGDHSVGSKMIKEELGLNKYKPTHSGFITKGDNYRTNPTCDQEGGICKEPVKVEWISGKASCELPWIGTINLFFNDIFSGKNTVGNVPSDSILCLIILIVILISIPVSLDIYSHLKNKKKKKQTPLYHSVEIDKSMEKENSEKKGFEKSEYEKFFEKFEKK